MTSLGADSQGQAHGGKHCVCGKTAGPRASMVSLAFVNTLLRAAGRVGLDEDAVVTALGLERERKRDPDYLLSGDLEDALWREIVRRAPDRAVAVDMARALGRGAFGGVEYLARSSDTFGCALAKLIRFHHVLHGQAVFALEGAAGRVRGVRYESPHWQDPEIAAYTAEFALASVVVLGRDAVGSEWFPDSVEFTHAAPTDDRRHRALFGDRIHFAAKADRLLFDRGLVETPMRDADPVLASVLEGYLVRELHDLEAEPGIAEAVRRRISGSLPEGAPSLESIARSIGLSPRALQRRLLDEDTNFLELLEQVRRALARGYLFRQELSMPAIANLLGYSDASAFQRAFKRWTGMTPAEFRRSKDG